MSVLNQPVTILRGVGQKKSEKLSRVGIFTVKDLLAWLPRDYGEYSKPKEINQWEVGQIAVIKAVVVSRPQTITTKNRLRITKIKVSDGYSDIVCVWYNQPYIVKQLKHDVDYILIGKIQNKTNQKTLEHPKIEIYHPEIHGRIRIEPIYQTIKGVSQKEIQKLIKSILNNNATINQELKTSDPFLDIDIQRLDFMDRAQTIREIHQPTTYELLGKALRRKKFEDFFWFRLMLDTVRMQDKDDCYAEKMRSNSEWLADFEQTLPFSLTKAQKRVIEEINRDLQSGKVMNRLVHGDVGSGKTMVALIAAIQVAKNSGQVAMIAPTEVLASQHFQTMQPCLQQLGYQTALLTGSVTAKNKKKIKTDIQQGHIQVVIGTHALFQEDVQFDQLRLVITDEQHRFGVKQRALLKNRGEGVHFLVMSATPIPRTIALAAYGDLNVSVIDEKPKNRQPIKTYCITSEKRQRAYNFVRQCVEKGEQAYVICPLVEENELINCQSAIELKQFLSKQWLKGLNIELLYGRLSGNEKNNVIKRFELGKINVLVSTTVVEVGVDVPNATVMIIENAERFGLAQLHQLRGRVGRNGKQAYCVLVSDASSITSKERLRFLTHSTDGFEIAELDLKMRGPGDFIGVRQHGAPIIDIDEVYHDNDLFEQAGYLVEKILENREKPTYEKINKEINHRLSLIHKDVIMN